MEQMLNILLVDDHPDFLYHLSLTLDAAGYNTLIARDGIEALDILYDQSIDLIVADIAMPRLNGYQLYNRIRQNPTWAMIPFIFLTARTLNSDIHYGENMGVTRYLTKPIQTGELLSAIHHNVASVASG